MNFSNYLNPFFPLAPVYEMPYYAYPPIQFHPAPVFAIEPPLETPQQDKAQNNSKEVDMSKLIQSLKTFHFEEVHHKKIHWTYEEDKLLQKLVEIQKLEWREIPKFFSGRTQNMCYSRYRRILMSTKQRNWSKEEEQLLLKLINRFGEKWKLISSKMTKFTSKQIRERYLNYLRPHINKQDFSFEEDLKICEYIISHGNHWRQMEEMLEGRPEGLIKGRYYGRLQKIIDSCYIEKRTQL